MVVLAAAPEVSVARALGRAAVEALPVWEVLAAAVVAVVAAAASAAAVAVAAVVVVVVAAVADEGGN